MRCFVSTGLAAGCLAAAACSTLPPIPVASSYDAKQHTQIMVVGSMHMAGSNSDLINIEVDNVFSADRQAELDSIARALAQFDPTHIVVERVTAEPDYIDPNFLSYSPETLTESANERVQIGYRLAHRLGLQTVHGIDESPEGDEPDYFPFETVRTHAETTGQGEQLAKLLADAESAATNDDLTMKGAHFARQLIAYNQGELADLNAQIYYSFGAFDVGEDQPGAELQAYWFMRNAKIFSKIDDVTEPGDRVLVVYGAGHKYWLDHFANNTPGFASVDPVPFLQRAVADN